MRDGGLLGGELGPDDNRHPYIYFSLYTPPGSGVLFVRPGVMSNRPSWPHSTLPLSSRAPKEQKVLTFESEYFDLPYEFCFAIFVIFFRATLASTFVASVYQ